MKRPLTNREQAALTWAKHNYRGAWRKRWGESREDHSARRPSTCGSEVWEYWYDTPFGNKLFTEHVRILRGLLQEGRI